MRHAYFKARCEHGGTVYIYEDETKTYGNRDPYIRAAGYEWYTPQRIEIVGVTTNKDRWTKADFVCLINAAKQEGAIEIGYRRYKRGSESERWVVYDMQGNKVRHRDSAVFYFGTATEVLTIDERGMTRLTDDQADMLGQTIIDRMAGENR